MVGLRFWPAVGVRTGEVAVGAEVDVKLGGEVGGTEVAVGGTAVAVGGGGGTVAVGSGVGGSVGTRVEVTVADGATVAEGSTVAVSAGTAVADRVAVTMIVGNGVRSPAVDVGVAKGGVGEAAPVVPSTQNPTS